jgi:hypothetical protein
MDTVLGRLGEPQDIADVVSLLAGKDPLWITGQNIRANGGIIWRAHQTWTRNGMDFAKGLPASPADEG